MKSDAFRRIVLAIVAVFVAIWLIRFVLGAVAWLFHTAVTIAVIAFIVWVIVTLLSRKSRAY